ncbi:MAG: preprotein translocase subunit SecE [Acidobacteriota bacterium]
MYWYKKFKQFLSEVWLELKKTSWPNRKEVYGTTIVVIIAVIICSAFLYVVDVTLTNIITFILKSFEK